MKRRMMTAFCLIMVCCLLPLDALAGLTRGSVVRITHYNAVNVRKGPSVNYGIVGEAMPTNTYTYLGEKDGWYHIQFTSDKDGWITAKYGAIEDGYVWEDDSSEHVEVVVRNTHYNALNVRAGANKNARVIGEIKPDTTWPYHGTENGWNCILYQGQYGYVAGNRTTIEEVVVYDYDTAGGATGSAANCGECGGTRTCQTCDGKGYVYSTMKKDNMDCPTCCGLGVCYACYDNSH